MMALILSCMMSKFCCKFLRLLSISNLSMVKDDNHFMPSSGQRMSVGSLSTPTGMTLVLSKLQAKPDMVWKSWMYFVAYCRLLAVRSMNIGFVVCLIYPDHVL